MTRKSLVLFAILVCTYTSGLAGQDSGEGSCALKWFRQPLDHFNANDHRAFSQRYYACDKYFSPGKGPIVLFLCGEGNCDTTKVLGAYPESLAKSLGAMLISLEHRYYGASLPFHRMGPEELHFLTPEQALEDTKNFVMKFQRHLTSRGLVPVHINNHGNAEADRQVPWIILGGSYGGALAAWFRAKYPELSVGSIASSAPVKRKISFSGFDADVGRVLGHKCRASVRQAVDTIEGSMEGNSEMSAVEVKGLFNATMLNDDDFSFMIGDVIAMTVQYGYKEMICLPLTHATSTKERISALAMHTSQFFFYVLETGGPSDYSSTLVSEELSDSDWGGRQWWWQRCTRLGYFETFSPEGVRPKRQTTSFYRNLCSRLFSNAPFPREVGEDWLFDPSLWTNATNIFFTNGGDDPWRLVSMTKPLAQSPTVLVGTAACSGCGHTVDLREPSDDDQPELMVLHAEVEETVRGWLMASSHLHHEQEPV